MIKLDRAIKYGKDAMQRQNSFICRTISFCSVCVIVFWCSESFSQSKSIKFDVAYNRDLPVGVAQQWLATLKKSGVSNVRLVVNNDQDIRIVEQGSDSSVTVFAKVDRTQRLLVPNRAFKISELKQIKEWVSEISVEKSAQARRAFGLTSAELIGVFAELGKPFPNSTKGQQVSGVVKAIGQQLQIGIGTNDSSAAALVANTKVPEELKGLSCGTVLAAIVRPLGLVVTIDKSRRKIQLVNSRDANEHWPVGWPPQQRPGTLAPELFKKTKVDIEDFPLNEILDAIQAKTKIPFIYDQNTLARCDVELQKVNVTIRPTSSFYDKIIRTALAKVKPQLTIELRVDEIGQPFLWVTKLGKVDYEKK